MTSLNRILVANRGEIACRIIRTIQAEGRTAIAVFSSADHDAPHVRIADIAIAIGDAPVSQSYLSIDKLIQAAKDGEADAIHPGYGFVSENPEMATACADAGIVFIGPDAQAISIMGNKAAAKRRMIKAGVPCLAGYEADDQSDAALISAASDIGYPLMVKAAAGGGGRGMRLVENAGALEDGLRLARSEAASAFGNDELILERAVIAPRHIEIQIIADKHGNTLHLGERDCSIQRRHQKIIEESPSPAVSEALRARMGKAAIRVAEDINYCGAGTVEFLLDDNGDFFFLEMNTRLQVEHPVTELITGLDLVSLQILVAEGKPLPFDQEQVRFNGHAIEARLYAEDTNNDFMPQTGKVRLWHPPELGLARTDSGIQTGDDVSPFYDPMLAKIIAHGATREAARRKLVGALGQTSLIGVTNNREFLIRALKQAAFIDGAATTAFIEDHMKEDTVAPAKLPDDHLAAIAWYLHRQRAANLHAKLPATLLGWRSDAAVTSYFCYTNDAGKQRIPVTSSREHTLVVGDTPSFDAIVLSASAHQCVVSVAGTKIAFTAIVEDSNVALSTASSTGEFICANTLAEQTVADDRLVRSPFHGRITELLVASGDRVRKGQRVAVLEAMKMQHDIQATQDGEVAVVHISIDRQVSTDEILIELEHE